MGANAGWRKQARARGDGLLMRGRGAAARCFSKAAPSPARSPFPARRGFCGQLARFGVGSAIGGRPCPYRSPLMIRNHHQSEDLVRLALSASHACCSSMAFLAACERVLGGTRRGLRHHGHVLRVLGAEGRRCREECSAIATATRVSDLFIAPSSWATARPTLRRYLINAATPGPSLERLFRAALRPRQMRPATAGSWSSSPPRSATGAASFATLAHCRPR